MSDSMDIRLFGKQNNLRLYTSERQGWKKGSPYKRFISCFHLVEVVQHPFRSIVHGEGNTEEEAVMDYAVKISEKALYFKGHNFNSPVLYVRPGSVPPTLRTGESMVKS